MKFLSRLSMRLVWPASLASLAFCVTYGMEAPGSGSTGVFSVTSPEWTNMARCAPEMKMACAPLPSAITRSGEGTSPELIAWLAALVPPPRMHLTRFHGVFAPHSKL